MSPMARPVSVDDEHRRELALIEWLGLTPEDVGGLTWTVTARSPERRGVTNRTTASGSGGTSSAEQTSFSGAENRPSTGWASLQGASELADVIGRRLAQRHDTES